MKQTKNDYRVIIRDREGKYIQYMDEFISLYMYIKLNDVGKWTLKNKTKSECPLQAGGGIIVYRNDVFIYSGLLKKVESEYNREQKCWEWTASGVSDLDYLKHHLIHPDADNAYPMEMTNRYADYLTGNFDCLATAVGLINDNLNSTYWSPIDFIHADGDVTTYESIKLPPTRFRFDNLFDVIVDILTMGKGAIYPKWENNNLTLYVRNQRDLTDTIQFDATQEYVKSVKHIIQAPPYNQVVMSYNRTFRNTSGTPLIVVEDPDFWKFWDWQPTYTEAGLWGVMQKHFEPNEEDFVYTFTWRKLQELTLAESNKVNPYVDGYSIVLGNSPIAPQYKIHYELGDIVKIILPDGQEINHVMTEITYNIAYGEESITSNAGTYTYGFDTDDKGGIYRLNKTLSKFIKQQSINEAQW